MPLVVIVRSDMVRPSAAAGSSDGGEQFGAAWGRHAAGPGTTPGSAKIAATRAENSASWPSSAGVASRFIILVSARPMTGSVSAATNTRAIGLGSRSGAPGSMPGSAPAMSISTEEWYHGSIWRTLAASTATARPTGSCGWAAISWATVRAWTSASEQPRP